MKPPVACAVAIAVTVPIAFAMKLAVTHQESAKANAAERVARRQLLRLQTVSAVVLTAAVLIASAALPTASATALVASAATVVTVQRLRLLPPRAAASPKR